ncbi:OmpA family protein, partial [Candidatus Aerophobetes bacterium]|nr:OmpA family protein [Candidatus Aerophobetes bacterium]
NWELSAARAISVANYLIQKGISPERIGVIGYADTRPLFPNDTPEHRALNRRVEILILR